MFFLDMPVSHFFDLFEVEATIARRGVIDPPSNMLKPHEIVTDLMEHDLLLLNAKRSP